MPRFARVLSSTGMYHIMLRGINKMNLFRDEEDKERFLDVLSRMREKGGYTIYAYCLMDNHVHLLLKEEEQVHLSMKRIAVSYSYYFNHKYNRVGHVFQDRFRSEPIEDDRYLLACVRYIHNNPVKAGIVPKRADYRWSSYIRYVTNNNTGEDIVDKGFILGIFSTNENEALQLFNAFSAEEADDQFIDVDQKEIRFEPEKIASVASVRDILEKHNVNVADIKDMDVSARNTIIRELKANTTISARELGRIIGVSKDIVNRA